MSHSQAQVERSKWPHFFAVTLVCATFPLIWVGGLVTTYDAGMAVPDWPTTFGYNMFLYPVSTWVSGPWDLFIEHGHRLLGSLAGMLTIALNVAIWRCDNRKWMRWAGLAALALVVSQGLLGGMRVRLNSTDFARIHGCTGPMFFAVTVAISVMTSRFWHTWTADRNFDTSARVVIGGWILVGLTYLQLIFGAHLRHPNVTWSPGLFRTLVVFHIVGAILLLAHTVTVTWKSRSLVSALRRPAGWLALLILGQVVLGLATWRAKYGWPSFVPMVSEVRADQPYEIALHNTLVGATVQSESMTQALTVTSHVALGSLILAFAVCYATRATRCYFRQSSSVQKDPSTEPNSVFNGTLQAVGLGGVA